MSDRSGGGFAALGSFIAGMATMGLVGTIAFTILGMHTMGTAFGVLTVCIGAFGVFVSKFQ